MSNWIFSGRLISLWFKQHWNFFVWKRAGNFCGWLESLGKRLSLNKGRRIFDSPLTHFGACQPLCTGHRHKYYNNLIVSPPIWYWPKFSSHSRLQHYTGLYIATRSSSSHIFIHKMERFFWKIPSYICDDLFFNFSAVRKKKRNNEEIFRKENEWYY